jgi:hypothetical protein
MSGMESDAWLNQVQFNNDAADFGDVGMTGEIHDNLRVIHQNMSGMNHQWNNQYSQPQFTRFTGGN